jgi:hypothetical protein
LELIPVLPFFCEPGWVFSSFLELFKGGFTIADYHIETGKMDASVTSIVFP